MSGEDDDEKVTLGIKCDEETRKRFKEFAAGYTNYEQALNDMLDVYDGMPGIFKGRR